MIRFTTLLVLVIAGCAAPPTPCESGCDVARPEFQELDSADGTWRIEWQATPRPIPLNQPFDLVVYLTAGASGGSLEDAQLDINARMPHHRHGMTRRPRVTRRADGGYDVSGMLFHMPGYWELHFDVTARGVTERAQVEMIVE